MREPQPIENHAIIGDLHTVALVALDGTIDFLCFPRFDSPTIIGRPAATPRSPTQTGK